MTDRLDRDDERFALGLLINGVPRNWATTFGEDDDPFRVDRYARIARSVEAAGFDLIFLADGVATSDRVARGGLEPLTLLSALAVLTERIGLVASVSTSFTEPFNLARQIASLDQLSGGRAGWNIVTSSGGGENFGRADLPHDERYRKGAESAEVVLRLWRSWGEEAIVRDRATRRFFDDDQVRAIDFAGEFFSVRGPLNVPRSPQGIPLLAQAGSSEAGQEVGARYADLIFTTGLPSVEESIAFADRAKARAAAHGRARESVRVLPGVSPVIGSTEEEARRIWEDSVRDLDVWRDAEGFAKQFSIDIAQLELDAPLPREALPREEDVEGRRSRYGVLLGLIESRRIVTLRDLVRYTSTAAGHWFPIGTPEQIASQFLDRYRRGAADGFNVLGFFDEVPGGLEALTDGLVPALRANGLLRERPASGPGLRGSLGLPDRSEPPIEAPVAA